MQVRHSDVLEQHVAHAQAEHRPVDERPAWFRRGYSNLVSEIPTVRRLPGVFIHCNRIGH